MKLFSTSGIRRKVTKLSPEFVTQVGMAISEAICKNSGADVFLARDARLTGPMLENAIAAGVVAGGCNIIKKGIIPTPALAYHTHKMKSPAGIMLTASHNPPEYNGIKVFDTTSMGLSPKDEEKIEKVIANKKIKQVSWKDFGDIKEELGSDYYHKMLLDAGSNINIDKFGTIIADPGGGAGCQMVTKSLKEIGLNLITINALFDPFFSARPSEPVGENLSELMSFVKKHSKEKDSIGLAFDGDADRCVAIDEKGRFIPLDVLIALYSKFVIEQNSGKGLIITHVDASMLIDKLVTEAGGKVKRTKVGDVAIGNMVASEKALFGGEPCGAWIHPKHHLCPDGPLTGIKILEWAAERGPLYELVDDIADFPVYRGKVDCENEHKKTVLQKLDKIISAEDDHKSLLKIDGLRINFEDDSWVLIRPSGTEPYFRVTSQAMTKEESKKRLNKYKKLVKQEIDKVAKK